MSNYLKIIDGSAFFYIEGYYISPSLRALVNVLTMAAGHTLDFEVNKWLDICFTRPGHLNKQIASVHERKEPFQCNLCDASFTQKGYLNEHIESVHE